MLLNVGDGFSNKEEVKEPKNSKVIYFIIFALVMIIVIIFGTTGSIISPQMRTYTPDKEPDKSAVIRYERLKDKLEKGIPFEKDEWIEFCTYANLIDNVIYEECLCDGEDKWKDKKLGINWVLPPNIDELLELPDFYETDEFYHEMNTSKRRYIKHKKFPEILIGYDEYHLKENGKKTPAHYHRYKSSDKKDKKKYLNECGEESKKGHDDSHIFIDTLKIKKIMRLNK